MVKNKKSIFDYVFWNVNNVNEPPKGCKNAARMDCKIAHVHCPSLPQPDRRVLHLLVAVTIHGAGTPDRVEQVGLRSVYAIGVNEAARRTRRKRFRRGRTRGWRAEKEAEKATNGLQQRIQTASHFQSSGSFDCSSEKVSARSDCLEHQCSSKIVVEKWGSFSFDNSNK